MVCCKIEFYDTSKRCVYGQVESITAYEMICEIGNIWLWISCLLLISWQNRRKNLIIFAFCLILHPPILFLNDNTYIGYFSWTYTLISPMITVATSVNPGKTRHSFQKSIATRNSLLPSPAQSTVFLKDNK